MSRFNIFLTRLSASRHRAPDPLPPAVAGGGDTPPESMAPAGARRRPTAAEARAAAEAAGRAEALAYANEITALCAVARRPELASKFLKADAPVDAVRRSLVGLLAGGSDEPEISSQISPPGVIDGAWARATARANQAAGVRR